MTAPDETSSTAPADSSDPTPPPPPEDPPANGSTGRRPLRQRLRDYHDNRLDGGGRGTVIGALIALFGVGLTVWATLYTADDDEKDPSDSKPVASAPPTAGQSSADTKPQERESQAPSPTPSTQASANSYELVYKDRKVGVSKPAGWDFGTLDLDRPRAQTFGSAEYKRMQEDAEAEGKLVEPDLLYRTDAFTELVIEEGRTAVHTDASPPTQPEQCAADAEAGGFDAMRMDQWPAEVGSGFCLITDQGNVVRLQITRFDGGERDIGRPPQRVEFSATMWRVPKP